MQEKRSSFGRMIGGVLLVVAIGAVFFFKPKPQPVDEALIVRPVKSLVVGDTFGQPELYFPGLVGASAGVDLSFEVGGRLIEMPVKKGQSVSKGDLLGRLDPRDFENEVKNAEAERGRAQSSFDRMAKALESNAVSKADYDKAKADLDKAEAQLAIKRKALDDTRLLARFDGLIANITVDTFDTLAAGTPILTLQDVSQVTIDVAVPEQYVINGPQRNPSNRVYKALFDGLPGRRFDVTFKEFTTKADERTQTYLASFTMPAPTDVRILPGMSATIAATGMSDVPASQRGIAVPSDAVGLDGQGQHFVWVLEQAEAGTLVARKRAVSVGDRQGASIQVLSGLKAGERIATAGVSLLIDGRKVTLLKARQGKEGE
jgi:RND family efflux transporter MFP subunit